MRNMNWLNWMERGFAQFETWRDEVLAEEEAEVDGERGAKDALAGASREHALQRAEVALLAGQPAEAFQYICSLQRIV